MAVEIRIAQNEDAEEWDSIVSHSSHGTIFHSWNWLKIVEKHSHSKLYPLIGMQGSTPVGVFPLFFRKKGPLRKVSSPPRHVATYFLGPALIGFDTLKQEKRENVYIDFITAVEHFITHDLTANYIDIFLPPALQDPRPFTWSGYSVRLDYDYVVDLSNGIDNLFENLDRKHRSDLKRAKDKGMSVEIGSKKDYEKILALSQIRFTQQGKLLPAPKDFLLDLFEAFEDHMKIFVVKIEGEIVTGTIYLQYKDTLYLWIGNAKTEARVTPSPNHLLYCESIRYAVEHELKYFVILGSADHKRLHKFYAARFNPELRIRYIARKKSILTGVFLNGYSAIGAPLHGLMKRLGPSDE